MTKRKSWAARLETAKERGKFTWYEKGLVDMWTTCAVGERHNFPTFYYPSIPSEEDRLGMEFMRAVQGNEVDTAIDVYQQILALPPVK